MKKVIIQAPKGITNDEMERFKEAIKKFKKGRKIQFLVLTKEFNIYIIDSDDEIVFDKEVKSK